MKQIRCSFAGKYTLLDWNYSFECRIADFIDKPRDDNNNNSNTALHDSNRYRAHRKINCYWSFNYTHLRVKQIGAEVE